MFLKIPLEVLTSLNRFCTVNLEANGQFIDIAVRYNDGTHVGIVHSQAYRSFIGRRS